MGSCSTLLLALRPLAGMLLAHAVASQAVCTIASPANLPNGAPGAPYAQAITATGGTAPYTFSAVGTMVPGLTLSSAGVLSGTPLYAGRWIFTVKSTDALSCVATKVYNVSVVSAHQCASPSFSRNDVGTASSPNSLVAGDFNNDGIGRDRHELTSAA